MITLPRNIPLYIHPTFWILASLIGWLGSQSLLQFGLWVIIVFISVLVHELGHALTARIWYKRVHIELGGMGGLTVRKDVCTGTLKEFVIVLMGPLFGLVLSFLAYFLLRTSPQSPPVAFFLYYTYVANLFWSLFNLLPVHPLDGGKLMTITFEGVFGLKGARFSYLLSGIFAILLAVLAFIVNYYIVGAFFLLFAYESYRSFQSGRHVSSSGEDQDIIEEIEKAEADWQQNLPDRAITRLETIVKSEEASAVFFRALETLVGFFLASGETQKAYSILLPYKRNLSGQMRKQYQLACFKLGLWEESLQEGIKAFREEQDVACAILNAFCSAHLGNAKEAVHWLTAVKRDRGVDIVYILDSSELDPIRQDPHFQNFVSKS